MLKNRTPTMNNPNNTPTKSLVKSRNLRANPRKNTRALTIQKQPKKQDKLHNYVVFKPTERKRILMMKFKRRDIRDKPNNDCKVIIEL
jgi:hypothetical protein